MVTVVEHVWDISIRQPVPYIVTWMHILSVGKCVCGLIHLVFLLICQTEAFAVCENYSPPEGFKEEDLYHLLEKVGTPSGVDDLGKDYKCSYNTLLPRLGTPYNDIIDRCTQL
jgi:hypothetical protein